MSCSVCVEYLCHVLFVLSMLCSVCDECLCHVLC